METRNRKSIPKPGAALRSRLILNGISMRQWAKDRGYPLGTVYSAVHGRRRGPKSKRIIQELEALSK